MIYNWNSNFIKSKQNNFLTLISEINNSFSNNAILNRVVIIKDIISTLCKGYISIEVGGTNKLLI